MNYNNKPFVLILLGPPGSGKGTQAAQISQLLHIPHISTGEIFRKNIKNHTPLGKKAQFYIDKGNLVPDDIVMDMLQERIKCQDCHQGYILDGVPRTLYQAELFTKILKNNLPLVINFDIPEKILMQRLTNRRVCSQCNTVYHLQFFPPKKEGICDKCQSKLYQRSDDTEKVIKERLDVYQRQTKPLIQYYQQHPEMFVNIDAKGSIHNVQEMLLQIIKKHRK